MIVARRVLKPIVVPPYSYSVYFAFKREELDHILNKKGLELEISIEACHGLCLPLEDHRGVSFCLIYIEDYDEETLYHEVLHAVHFMMSERGVPTDVSTTEVQAYHQGWLADQIKKEIKKRGH